MNSLVTTLIEATKDDLIPTFVPELVLCVTIISLLLGRLFNCDRLIPSYWIALAGTLIAFGFSLTQFRELADADQVSHTLFTGMLVYDAFAIFFRVLLLLFLVLVVSLTVLSGIPDNEDGPDFYVLMLGSVVGMMLMSSANHLLILFLGIEMASVPSYALVGFLKGRRESSEASLKFVVYGAGAAGVMLYGISLLMGMAGTGDMSLLGSQLSATLSPEGTEAVGLLDPGVRTVVLGFTMLLVGFAFKLSVFPFHFWTPDAFQGASAEVGGFLSVASKAAAFALLVRVVVVLTGGSSGVLSNVYLYFGIGIGVMAAITATFGNLAAYTQTNVKRLLAYSTIAHAGYMLMAISALMVVQNAPASVGLTVEQSEEMARRCIEGLLYYIVVYLFMNLGAFAIVALIRNQIFSEELEDYRGLSSQTPTLCVCMLICMFSLIGMPPFGGFVGKLMIFAALYSATAVHWSMWVILIAGGMNTVFGLFYYLRVLKAMFLEQRPEGARTANIPLNSSSGMYVVMISVPVVLLGIVVGQLSELAQGVADVVIR